MASPSLTQSRLRPFRPVRFGRYTLLAPLATGGMGEVFLAQVEGEAGLGRLCVIKRVLPQLAQDPEFLRRFAHEARTLVTLSHGAIAQVLELGNHRGQPYLALERVDGKDLRKVAARLRDLKRKAPLGFVLYVMGRVLEALAYAHRKRDEQGQDIGLVHRDVSPQNVLVSYEGEVKVIDFGLAKSSLSESRTNPSVIVGKFLYMSPEQARHHAVDRRSDLYSVGLCLYELIAGQNPFEGAAPHELLARVTSPSIPPLKQVAPECPPQVDALVMRALQVDPAQRYATAEEFRAKLQACLLELDPEAGPELASTFMHQVFEADLQNERRLLVSLREQARQVSDEEPFSDEHTAPSVSAPLTALPGAKATQWTPPAASAYTPAAEEVGSTSEAAPVGPPVEASDDDEYGLEETRLSPVARGTPTQVPVLVRPPSRVGVTPLASSGVDDEATQSAAGGSPWGLLVVGAIIVAVGGGTFAALKVIRASPSLEADRSLTRSNERERRRSGRSALVEVAPAPVGGLELPEAPPVGEVRPSAAAPAPPPLPLPDPAPDSVPVLPLSPALYPEEVVLEFDSVRQLYLAAEQRVGRARLLDTAQRFDRLSARYRSLSEGATQADVDAFLADARAFRLELRRLTPRKR